MVRQMRSFATLLALTAALSGCMQGTGPMSILSGSGRTPDATSRAALSVTDQQATSPLISDLMARHTRRGGHDRIGHLCIGRPRREHGLARHQVQYCS